MVLIPELLVVVVDSTAGAWTAVGAGDGGGIAVQPVLSDVATKFTGHRLHPAVASL